MNQLTKFEDLSSEIVMEIVDYMDAIEIFCVFGSLNRRISSILHLIRFHVLITSKHHRWHIKLLSNHLQTHADQVISFSIDDHTEDCSSKINFLFHRHQFPNLHSCVLKISSSFNELTSFIEQLKILTNLQSLSVIQPNSLLSQYINYDSNCSILNSFRSNTLRSLVLLYHYDQIGRLNAHNNPITLNLTNLELIVHVISQSNSIDSLIKTFHFCPLLRRLRLVIRNKYLVKCNTVV
jgi:hypothetical protein